MMKPKKKKITKWEIKKKEIVKRASYCWRIEERLQQKKEAVVYSTKRFYEALIKNATDKVLEKYTKKLERRLARIEKQYESKKTRQIKVKVYKKEVKVKQPTDVKIKQLAYTTYQLWRKMSLADKDGMVLLADNKGMCHYTKCVAGHIYSKHNNKHMAFLDINVRPITTDTNRVQGTAPWIYRACNVLNAQELVYLKTLSDNKLKKNDLLDRNYYQTMYEIYSERLKVEEKRLWITDNKYHTKK